VQKDLIKTTDSHLMDEMYTAGLLHPTRQMSRDADRPSEKQIQQLAQKVGEQTKEGKEDIMLLQRWNGKLIAEAFHLPEMEIEIERAVEQVEKSINKAKDDLVQEKDALVQSPVQKTVKVDEAKR